MLSVSSIAVIVCFFPSFCVLSRFGAAAIRLLLHATGAALPPLFLITAALAFAYWSQRLSLHLFSMPCSLGSSPGTPTGASADMADSLIGSPQGDDDAVWLGFMHLRGVSRTV